MLFSSVTFLFYFLPIVLITYYIVPNKFKNYILLLASIIFYAWGGLLYLPLLLISIVMNYFFGLALAKNDNSGNKKTILIISIVLNVLFLGVFKYSDFIINNINDVLNTSIKNLNLTLPIGISFYTFQAMSYVIDVYRNDGRVQKNIFSLALYVSMFPQLVAGPIVRYQTVDNQITTREHSFNKFNSGVERFIVGFFKKIVISNGIGELATLIYALPHWKMSVLGAWLGAIAYTLQIYFDFSGYSDMAIGLGKMFGFEFLENFNYPYISKSVGEFWRRWHISLGSWFRDYVYIPLGGNRVSRTKVYRNLFIVWLITGIWHGASWNFIIWGLYFGVFIMLERAFLGEVLKRIPKILQHIYLMIIVIIGWVIFSQPTLTSAIEYIKIMFSIGDYPVVNGYPIFYIKEYSIIIVLSIVLSVPILKNFLCKDNFIKNIVYILKPIVLIVCLGVTIVYLVNSTFNPFIYFNF